LVFKTIIIFPEDVTHVLKHVGDTPLTFIYN